MSRKRLTEIADTVCEAGDSDKLSVADVLDAVGTRAFGPLMVAIALVIISPVGAVPGLPPVLALLLVLVAGQGLAGRSHPWVPGFIARISAPRDRASETIGAMRPALDWIDRWTAARFAVLLSRPAKLLAMAAVIGLAVTMIPLEIIPYGVVPAGFAILLIGLGFAADDGLFAAAGLTAAAAAFAFTAWLLL